MDEEIREDFGRRRGEPDPAAIENVEELAAAADQARLSGGRCHD
jgi:hypothetical protein